jgi:dolichol kinase
MNSTLMALLLPPLLLVPAMGILSRIRIKHSLGEEWRRKALHIGIGLVALTFPFYLTTTWVVLGALGLSLIWMLAVRRLPFLIKHFGCVLHDVDRTSYGELYYALAIAALLLATFEEPLLYIIPLSILAIADAAAAIAGRTFSSRQLSGPFAGKTVVGCVTFFLIALSVCALVLATSTQLPVLQILLSSIAVAAVTTLVEAVSRYGLDNLLIPAAAWIVLKALELPIYIEADAVAWLREGFDVLLRGV